MTINLSSVNSAISMLARPATLTTHGGSYVDGIWQNAPTTKAISVVVQPNEGRNLRLLGEGQRVEGEVVLWTTEPIETVDETDKTAAQTITVDGAEYRIVTAAIRPEGGFTRATGRLVVDRGRSL